MWKGLMDINEKMLKDNPTVSVIGHDRVHPSYLGGFMMAYLFLNELEGTSMTSEVEIDVKENIVKANKATITALSCSDDGLSFALEEKSLPFPIDNQIKDAEKYVPFQEEMNRQRLKVKSLPKGNYNLFIDNHFIASYGHKKLAKGINLSDNVRTPQYKQAEKVSDLCEQLRIALHDYRKIKLIEWQRLSGDTDLTNVSDCLKMVRQLVSKDTEASDWIKSLYLWYLENKPLESSKLKKIDKLKRQIYDSAKPKVHTYKITCNKN